MDLNRIDLNLLVSLDVLLAECNVTRAAQRLSLSQPALSAQLRQLRALLDDPLLLPVARGMIPTARALGLQVPLRELLTQIGELVSVHKIFDPAVADNTFRIVTTDLVQAVVCARLSARLRKHAPDSRLALYFPDPLRLAEQLASGEIDLALVAPQAMPESLKTRCLYREQFLCVMRRGHPAAGKPLDLDTFCTLDHMIVSPNGGGFVGAVDEKLATIGRCRRVVVSVSTFLVIPALITQSDLICTVPARLAREWTKNLSITEPPCAVAGFEIHMGWHPRNHADPAQVWLREQVMAAGQ
jgi:DNA-binding transcriptional LysR family regulator